MQRAVWVVLAMCWGCGTGTGGDQGSRSLEPMLPPTEDPPIFQERNPCVADVQGAVESWEREGAALAAWAGPASDGGLMSWPRYTGTAQNGFGLNNHIQGVVRLRSAPAVVISGSNVVDDIGELFVASLPSRTGMSRWGSNLMNDTPAEPDQLELRFEVDAALWHAGGMSTLGNYLGVAIEGGGSVIDFYDMTDPLEPERLDARIERDIGSAAVALARLADDRIVALVRDGSTLDIYWTKTPSLDDGFAAESTSWHNDADLDGIGNMQNVHFVEQCDGRLFFLSANNTSVVAPTIPGDDNVYLFELLDPTGEPEVVPILAKNLSCIAGSNCNFDAGSSVYVTDDGELLYYGVRHFRDVEGSETILRLAEFAAP